MLGAFSACGGNGGSSDATTGGSGVSNITTLQVTDVNVGTGTDATNGKVVSVHYTGWLYNESAADKHGTKFDSSRDRNQPFEFGLGAGQVIRGWDQGVAGMKIGGQRTANGCNMAHALFTQHFLHIADRQPVDVQKLTNAANQRHIRRAVIAPPARPFDRLDLGKACLPKPQNMGGDRYRFGHF